ncbi:MAG TPA: universal stress protein [Hanamia sp.]|nr:universal stress protein [Hanamia sp.]
MLSTTDFSIASRNACEYAVSLTEDFGTKIALLHVFAPPMVIDDISAASLLVLHDEMGNTFIYSFTEND